MKQNELVEIKTIKKPKRLLLTNFFLSAYAQDIYSLIIIKLKMEFDKKYFKIDPSTIKKELLDNLSTDFIFHKDELSEILNLSNKIICKKDKFGSYLLQEAVQELRRAEIIVHNLKNDTITNDKLTFRVTGLINNGEWDGSRLLLNVDKYVCYELIEYSYNNGFSLIDKYVFFKIRDPSAKKIFELVSSDKRKNYSCNLYEYFKAVFDFNEDSFLQNRIIEKYLVRPINVLIRDSDGLITTEFHGDKGYKLSALGGSRGTSINGDTVIEFTLKHRERDIESEILNKNKLKL